MTVLPKNWGRMKSDGYSARLHGPGVPDMKQEDSGRKLVANRSSTVPSGRRAIFAGQWIERLSGCLITASLRLVSQNEERAQHLSLDLAPVLERIAKLKM